ncbi:hypothetical protein RH915_03445 [Serpentinicella sp. ANB-PHB4]|uniref:DUF6648 family protein n=1 Tax=Serpentinicella sp. ANB-PHB4 TaxID=3074076 RepID=UPI002856521F|nr:DUF6648 family protein [Serpentinicella sp. ANB-PHB4]MDR5658538.1 hypothetical protein [Serpentinicella sp. ANB-PHB4]
MFNLKYVQGENMFEKFAAQRDSLIAQFQKGDLTKKEFIEENYSYIQRMNVKPFKNIDSFEKAIYNYQYYNMMAKYCYLQAREMRKNDKHEDLNRDLMDKVNFYYRKKDQSTHKAVQILDYIGVEAYYIKVSSPNLKENLFEIIFKDYPKIILHSRNQWLLNHLKDELVFKEGTRKSLIENYINEKY